MNVMGCKWLPTGFLLIPLHSSYIHLKNIDTQTPTKAFVRRFVLDQINEALN